MAQTRTESHPTHRLPGVQVVHDVARRYGREPGTVEGYGVAMAVFAGVGAALVAAARLTGRRPGTLTPWELGLTALAAHKISRIVAKDSVTAPLRAPLTRFQGPAGDAEVAEDVRAHGPGHALGELLTCPFCLDPWVATALTAGRTFAPQLTGAVTTTFGVVALADLLHLGYAAAQQRTTPPEQRGD
jgi:hypothetical protein